MGLSVMALGGSPRRKSPTPGTLRRPSNKASENNPIRVAILDDDSDDRLMIRRYLGGARHCRFSVHECAEPSELQDLMTRTAVDVALIDQRLGDQQGTEFIRQIGGRQALIPSVLLTGSDDADLEEEAIISGAAEHLTKADLSSRVLERTIKYAIKSHGDHQELRRQGEQLQRAWTEAADANRAKSMFLASMSHELRTPLNAIIGFSSMLPRPNVVRNPKLVDEYAGYIQESGAHLLHLVNNLLDVARIEAGQYTLQDETVDLSRVLRSVVRANQPLADKHSVTIALALDPNMPPVRSDPSGLHQVFLNLLSNATKFTPLGGHVDISVASKRNGLRVTIRDNGIGMSEEDIEIALRPFAQILHNAYVRTTDGAGLGLAIVTALAKQLELGVRFESRPGHGTAVTVAIPAKRSIR